MDNLMRLYRENVRVNDFWKKYTHSQIDIAHRILEYLEPDEYFFPTDLKTNIMDAFLNNNISLAVNRILEELDIDTSDDYNGLQTEAMKFAEEVLVDFNAKRRQNTIKEREALIAKLAAINKELGLEKTNTDVFDE